MAVPLSLDAEVEQPRTPDRSVFVRTIVAYDFGQSLVRYLSVGAGMRYFVGLPKQQLLHTEAPATTVKSPAETARFHFYYGWSGGMSQVVLRVVTPALQTVAQMIEVGGHGGVTYALKPKISLEAMLGETFGYSFSSVSATVLTTQFTVGAVLVF